MQACTVVVISLNGGVNLEECLSALIAQGAPCVVMLGPRMPDAQAWRQRFPAIRFVDAEAGAVPLRRMRGIDAAGTEFVALLEDGSIPGPRWYAAMGSAFASPAVAAVGGPVTIADDIGHRQQALGCCEFGGYHPALVRSLALATARTDAQSFDVDRLPGNNIAYRVSALRSVTPSQDPLIETVANARLRKAGHALVIDAAMAVEYRQRGVQGTRWIDRFRHGRLYGGNLASAMSPLRRMLHFVKGLLLPFVLSARSLGRMTHAIPARAWFTVGALVCWMETAWAVGETVGILAGAGNSIEDWNG